MTECLRLLVSYLVDNLRGSLFKFKNCGYIKLAVDDRDSQNGV
jgi:hypothetical protein